jgi:hypothetical protein
MGWIRKTIRKVGRELGRTVEKIGDIFGSKSLGVLGTIGLSMMMPWTVSTVFNGLTDPSGWFAKTALDLGKDESIARKTAGYLMSGIHKGATSVQNGYNIAKSFVTDKVNEGLDYIDKQEKKPKDFIIKNSPLDEEIVDLSVDTKTNVADEILTNTYSDNRESKGILDKTKDFIQDQSKKLLDKQIDIKSPTRNAYTSGDLGNGKGFNFVANRTPLQRANNLKLNNEGFYYGNFNYMDDIKNSSFGQSEYYDFFKEIETDRTLSE